MLGKTYKDETGKLHTFEEILEFFDILVSKNDATTHLTYAPRNKSIGIYSYHEKPLIFTEI